MSLNETPAVNPAPAASAAHREMGVLAGAWKLLRLRLVIMWNEFRRAKLRRKIVLVFVGLSIAAVLGFIVFFSVEMLKALRSPEMATVIGQTSGSLDRFMEAFPVMMISSAAVGILLTSFGVMLQALYLSGDMDFLMSTPIPVRSIFIAKLVQGILPNFAILCFFILPMLFGLGISGRFSWVFYPATLLLLIALTLAAAGLASLLVMLAARFFPARRMAEVLGFIVGTSFFIFSQSGRFVNMDLNQQQMQAMLNLAQRFDQPWSPLAWGGRGLTLLGERNWLSGAGLTAASLLAAVGVFYLALVTAERLYYTGWASLQSNHSGRKKKPAQKPAAAGAAPSAAARPNALARLLPSPVRAVIVKDWLLYRRDLRNASRLITPLILGVVYAVSLLQSGGQVPEGEGNAPAWFMDILKGIFLYADVALALFMGWMLAANLGGLGFSLEGKRYWMLKAAPLDSRTLLASKFLVAYIPSLVVCELYILILQALKGFVLWDAALSVVALAAIMAGLTGIYLAFGVTGARFSWDNPNETGRTIGCLGSLAGMVYAPLCFAFFAAPPILAALVDLPVWLGQLVGLALGCAAGIAAAIIPLALVQKRVDTLMES